MTRQEPELDQRNLAELPVTVRELFARIDAPPRLVAHLTLVHDVAVRIVTALEVALPNLLLSKSRIAFGAATHDIGKAVHREELTGSGHEHERAGYELLLKFGVSEQDARFTLTHADLTLAIVDLSDVIVALADKCWKGKRDESVETRVCAEIAGATGLALWEVTSRVDEIVTDIAAQADDGLAWQGRFSP
jgi:hypothetical protein